MNTKGRCTFNNFCTGYGTEKCYECGYYRRTNMITFNLTEEHIKLARRMNVYWDDAMYLGAPAIDMKRPYGNSDVLEDILEILDEKPVEDVDERIYTKKQYKKAEALHREMETALQVILAAGSFEPGVYTAEKYRNNWRKS